MSSTTEQDADDNSSFRLSPLSPAHPEVTTLPSPPTYTHVDTTSSSDADSRPSSPPSRETDTDSDTTQNYEEERALMIGTNHARVPATDNERREVEREIERPLLPLACGVGDCQGRYKDFDDLRTFLPTRCCPIWADPVGM